MGLTVSIYKERGRSYSNRGVSQFMDEGVLVNVAGTSEPDSVRKAALALVRNGAGMARVVPVRRLDAIPSSPKPPVIVDTDGDLWEIDAPTGAVGPMMGGCYVAAPGSSFTEAVEKLVGANFYGAVALHDRFETTKEYDALSA